VDRIEAVLASESDRFGEVHRVAYRFATSDPDGRCVVEQQAYYTVREGHIGWMSVLCSGFRPRVD
jgi:hypothetical protein